MTCEDEEGPLVRARVPPEFGVSRSIKAIPFRAEAQAAEAIVVRTYLFRMIRRTHFTPYFW